MDKSKVLLLAIVLFVAKCSDQSKSLVDNGELTSPENTSSYVYDTGIIDLTVYKGSSGYSEYASPAAGDVIWKLTFHVRSNPSTAGNIATTEVYLSPSIGLEVLDEQPVGYGDVLNRDESISKINGWSSGKIVLASTDDSLVTTIEGDQYIGIRIRDDHGYLYGWVALNLFEYDDRMQITVGGYCYRTERDKSILAGQKE